MKNNQMQIRVNQYQAYTEAYRRRYAQDENYPSHMEIEALYTQPEYCTDRNLFDE